jgi:hypothetical protein
VVGVQSTPPPPPKRPNPWRSYCIEQVETLHPPPKHSSTILGDLITVVNIIRRDRHHRIQLLFPFASQFPPPQRTPRQLEHLSRFWGRKGRKRRHHQVTVLCRAVPLTLFEPLADLGAKIGVVENHGPCFICHGRCVGLCQGKRAPRCTRSSLWRREWRVHCPEISWEVCLVVVLVVVGCLALGLRLRRSVCLWRRALLRARFAGGWRLCRLRGRCRPLFLLAGDLAIIFTLHDVSSLSFSWAYHRQFKTSSGHVKAWKESNGKLTANVFTLNYRCLERHIFSSKHYL